MFSVEDWSDILPNLFSNLITNDRKGLMVVIFAQSIKPGVPKIVEPVFLGNTFFI